MIIVLYCSISSFSVLYCTVPVLYCTVLYPYMSHTLPIRLSQCTGSGTDLVILKVRPWIRIRSNGLNRAIKRIRIRSYYRQMFVFYHQRQFYALFLEGSRSDRFRPLRTMIRIRSPRSRIRIRSKIDRIRYTAA